MVVAKGNGIVIVYCVNVIQCCRRVCGAQLAALGVIHLVAVIFLGIVGGGDHHPCVTVQIPGGKRQHRHRHQPVVQIHLQAAVCKNARRRLGKVCRVIAGVVSDSHFQVRLAGGFQIIGKAQGGLTYGVTVHPVRPGAHNAPQAAGAKGQVLIEPILDLFFVRQAFQFRLGVRVGKGKPLPVFLFVIHPITLHLKYI